MGLGNFVSYPPLVQYASEAEYQKHFERTYCRALIPTFDGITVRFRKDMFTHIFYESSNRDGVKNVFSTKRAERIDWIKAVLQDSKADLYVGWDNKKKSYDTCRRVALVLGNYVVIIRLLKDKKAVFVTAYLADSGRTLEMIKRGPKWT